MRSLTRRYVPDGHSHVDPGPTCDYCRAELRFLKLATGKRLPVERAPSETAGYVYVSGGVAEVLSVTQAADARAEGYPLFTIHDCAERRTATGKRSRRPSPLADVVALPKPDPVDQLPLDGAPITPSPPADLAERRVRRARRRVLGGDR